VSSNEDDIDDERQEDDQTSKEDQPDTKAVTTPQQEWAERHKTVKPVVEQVDKESSQIVELLDIDIDEDLPHWKKKLLQKKKIEGVQATFIRTKKGKR